MGTGRGPHGPTCGGGATGAGALEARPACPLFPPWRRSATVWLGATGPPQLGLAQPRRPSRAASRVSGDTPCSASQVRSDCPWANSGHCRPSLPHQAWSACLVADQRAPGRSGQCPWIPAVSQQHAAICAALPSPKGRRLQRGVGGHRASRPGGRRPPRAIAGGTRTHSAIAEQPSACSAAAGPPSRRSRLVAFSHGRHRRSPTRCG